MLFIVCALACEAKPLVTHFRLQLANQFSSFSLYMNPPIYLIVTGIGKILTAVAMGYLQGIINSQVQYAAWLNVGIAGHASLTLGKGILAHQILDQASGRSYYPMFVIDRPVTTAIVRTVDQPEIYYKEEGVYDMEASAFWNAASRFTTAELIHSYKIISDNCQSGASCLKKSQVEELVQINISSIESFISSLLNLNQILNQLDLPLEELTPFLKKWHFTNTQKIQLKRLLQRWKICTNQSTEVLWNTDLPTLSRAQQVIQNLEKRLQHLTYLLS